MTRQHQLLQLLARATDKDEGVSVAQIAEKFGIGLERARILLEILRLRSKVKREAVQRTEGPGRPTFQYQITKPGRKQLDRLNQKKG